VGTVVTGCPEMKFQYFKKDLRTPATTDAVSFEIDTLSIFHIWTWNLWGSSTAFIEGRGDREVDKIHNEEPKVLSVLLTQYCSGDKIENNEMGRTCSANGEEERRLQGFGGET
jgi:hypothetical protein